MLTNDQITQIDKYFEKNGIRFYDLRTELVDHVSQSIEEEMKLNQVTFEIAFDKESRKFSKKALVETNFEARLNNSGGGIQDWKYFTFSRIIVFIAILFALITPAFFVDRQSLSYYLIAYGIFAAALYIFLVNYSLKNLPKPKKQVSIYSRKSLFQYFLIPLYPVFVIVKTINKNSLHTTEHPFGLFVFLVFLLLMPLVMILIRYDFQAKQYSVARKVYPQLFN